MADTKPGDADGGAEEALADGKLLARIELTRSDLAIVYTSAETAKVAAQILPSLGDSLPADATGTIRSARTWTGFQVWTQPEPPHNRPTSRRRR